MYKTSNYNIITKANENLLMYNTKTGYFVGVSNPMAGIVEKMLKNKDYALDDTVLKNLYKTGFIIDSDKDEFEEIKEFALSKITDKKTLRLTLLPAESCNFSCPYCFVFEKRNLFMTNKVYDSVFKLIEKNITPDFNLFISWFGGEPTLAKKNIIWFSKRLNRLSEKHNFNSINYEMVTNGYLFSVEDFQTYLELGCNSYQITLDGYGRKHDETRSLKTGKGSFDTIWKNLLEIKNLKEDFHISVRHNFMKNQYSNSRKLLSEFLNNFKDDPRFSIYFRPVYNFSQKNNEIKSIESNICGYKEGLYIQKELDAEFYRERSNEDFNLTAPLPIPTPYWCDTAMDNFYVVGADGSLFKCDSYIGEEEKRVGHLLENGDIRFNSDVNKWKLSNFYNKDLSTNKMCLTCKILPICQGGCARVRVESGNPCYWNEDLIKEIMVLHHNKVNAERD